MHVLARLLSEPRLAGVDIDSPDRVIRHLAVLDAKPMTREVFEDFYRLALDLDRRHFGNVEGLRVELGAGVSRLKKLAADVVVTDVVPAPHIDRTLNAIDMDLPDNSVRCLIGINCFHHFPDVRAFFRETLRVAKPGGGAILIEPHFGPLAGFIYKRLFTSETFDVATPSWNQGDVGPMQGANQALSHVVFERDRAVFQNEFPELEIIETTIFNNYIRYLVSGGLNFRQLLPDAAIPLLKAMEAALAPAAPVLALHRAVVLRKRSGR